MKALKQLLFLSTFLCATSGLAQLTTNTNVTATDLVNNISGGGVIFSNATINCSNGAYATFDGSNSNVGINNGILLTTGLAEAPPNSCVYSLSLYDTGNDGWTCGAIEVYLDGVLTGTYSENSTWGSTNFNLIVGDGQQLELVYVTSGGPGCDEAEHSYELMDDNFNIIANVGGFGTGGPIPAGSLYTGVVVCGGGGGGFAMFGAAGPNSGDLASWSWGTITNDPDLTAIDPGATNDVCILEFDIMPTCDTLEINYVFASEEYPNFVGSYNDVFAFFLSGPGINGPYSNNAINIATIPGTNTPVSIDNVNNGIANNGPCTNCAYYVNNGVGDDCWNNPPPAHCGDSTIVRYNGLTVPLTAKAAVQACQTYHMKIAIADAVDHSYDSGVFLTYQGLTCPNGSSISVNMINDTVVEGCFDGEFELIRDGDSTNVFTVTIDTLLGTATSTVDYVPPTDVTFAAFDTIETVTIPGLFDGIAEGAESIQIVISYPLCGGQLVTDTINLTIVDEPTLSFIPTPEDCGQCNGLAQVNMGAGSTAPYTYQWDANAANQTTQTAANLCSGIYAVTVTDANGCTAIDSVSITAIGGPQMTLTITDESCLGAGDGNIVLTPVGGGPFSYEINGVAQGNGTFSNLSPGNYTLTLVDLNLGCQTDSVVTVGAGPCCLLVTSNGTDVACFADCNGTANATPSNSYGTVTYNWLDENNAPIGQTTATASNLCAGIYYVEVVDSLCAIVDTVIINEPPQIVVTVSDTTICIGGSAALVANVSNGISPFTFNWDNGGNTQTINVTPGATTDYIVAITDANGCIALPDTATVDFFPALQMTVSNDTSICGGEQVVLNANVSGGMGAPYGFSWTDNGGNGWTANTSTVTVTPTSTTSYYITSSDGCSTPTMNDTIVVTVSPTPVVTFTADTSQGCFPVMVNFTNTTAIAGTCDWTFGNGWSTDCNPSQNFVVPGCYDITLVVTSADGCVGDTTIPSMICVHDFPTPDFNWLPNPTTILDPTINFTNTTVNGVTYTWYFDSLGTSTEMHPSFVFPEVPETYQVCLVAETANGCVDTVCYDVVIEDEELVFVPNAFTPDGDGINSYFAPVLNFTPLDYEFMIFNRWGELIFEANDPGFAWGGTHKGEAAQQGIYVWRLLVTDGKGERHEYMGHVTLIR